MNLNKMLYKTLMKLSYFFTSSLQWTLAQWRHHGGMSLGAG